ncbi:MAG: DUF5947 family protein [Myxococcales bacterium]|nr:DUF5947 family protein [Myxococcales bacterium]
MTLSALRRYVRESAPPPPRESCEMCGVAVPEGHRHLVDLEKRSILCSCHACALLFDRPQARFRSVPDAAVRGLTLSDEKWSLLGIPVRLAFVFFNSTLRQRVACYPSVAGPIESEIAAESWERFAREASLPREPEPDVEALLVRGRRGEAGLESFVAPIDVCYRLVAVCRTHWRGFDGGDDVRREMDAFFADLERRCA